MDAAKKAKAAQKKAAAKKSQPSDGRVKKRKRPVEEANENAEKKPKTTQSKLNFKARKPRKRKQTQKMVESDVFASSLADDDETPDYNPTD